MLHVSYLYCSLAYQEQPWNRAQSQVGFVVFPSPCILLWHIKVRLEINYKTRTAPYFLCSMYSTLAHQDQAWNEAKNKRCSVSCPAPCILLWHIQITLGTKHETNGFFGLQEARPWNKCCLGQGDPWDKPQA